MVSEPLARWVMWRRVDRGCRLIAESPALPAGEQQIYATYTGSLAAVLAEGALGRSSWDS
jgi:hypothetical protein